MPTFEIGDEHFLLDGARHRVISGALHYFRVHPEQWADRIRKARLMGLNTIETYVPWNAHAPTPGSWDVSGALDLGRFLDLVHAEGMHAIVRPGPYICAEWHNGGLPAWLLRIPGIGLRSSEPQYLAAVDEYLRRVYEIVAPRQIDRGGPVVLVQIENEYGAYGSDPDYLRELVRITRDAGITVPLTTVDQPTDEMLAHGSLPELHRTGSFGSRSDERLAILRRHQSRGPLMCSEFWDGWFDSWGTPHHTTSVHESAADLDRILAVGGSVNLYMFHGGTNFGLTNGANHRDRYEPIVTSYDYDAPLDEAGNPTAKYWAYREVIGRYAPVPDQVPDAAAPAPAFSTGPLVLSAFGPRQSGPVSHHLELPTFEAIGHDRGLACFTTEVAGGGVLSFGEVRDRAWVSLDGVHIGTLARDEDEGEITLPGGGTVTVLVEDCGRVNYGPLLGEEKGLIGGARLDGVPVTGWEAVAIDLDAVARGTASPDSPMPGAASPDGGTPGGFAPDGFAPDGASPDGASPDGSSPDAGRPPTAPPDAATSGGFSPDTGEVGAASAVVGRVRFNLDDPADLFLDTSGWGKGFAWINGFALGRYWSRGPQRTLYVPAPVTRGGCNDLVILELESRRESLADPAARFVPAADLGAADPGPSNPRHSDLDPAG